MSNLTILRVLWLIVLMAFSSQVYSDNAPANDERIRLGLSMTERAEFLAEMREMLASIQGIVAGMGEDDRARIAAAAKYSGNRMARATPASVRAKLPVAFQEIGGPTHMLFEEIAIRAD